MNQTSEKVCDVRLAEDQLRLLVARGATQEEIERATKFYWAARKNHLAQVMIAAYLRRGRNPDLVNASTDRAVEV